MSKIRKAADSDQAQGDIPSQETSSMSIVRKEGNDWEIKYPTPEQGSLVPRIIKAIKDDGEKEKLTAKIKETFATEPIKAAFAVLAGIVLAFLVWVFKLTA